MISELLALLDTPAGDRLLQSRLVLLDFLLLIRLCSNCVEAGHAEGL